MIAIHDVVDVKKLTAAQWDELQAAIEAQTTLLTIQFPTAGRRLAILARAAEKARQLSPECVCSGRVFRVGGCPVHDPECDEPAQ